MSPVRQLLLCSLLGSALALYYECLRPLRRKRNWPGDLLLIPALIFFWMLLFFPLCRTDLRAVHLGAFASGFLLWDLTLGSWLQPVFYLAARYIFKFLSNIFRFLKKYSKKLVNFLKFLYATGRKWVTIDKLTRKLRKRSSGGEAREKDKKRKAVHS